MTRMSTTDESLLKEFRETIKTKKLHASLVDAYLGDPQPQTIVDALLELLNKVSKRNENK